VLRILYAWKDPALQSTDMLKVLAVSMHSMFEKYWNPDEDNLHNVVKKKRKKKEIAFNLVLVIATILDPRRKADYLDFFFQKVCNNTNQIDMHVKHALEWMGKYFTLYEQRCARKSSVDMMVPANEAFVNVGSLILGKRKLEEEFAQYKS